MLGRLRLVSIVSWCIDPVTRSMSRCLTISWGKLILTPCSSLIVRSDLAQVSYSRPCLLMRCMTGMTNQLMATS